MLMAKVQGSEQTAPQIKIVLDTDIGDDIDDAYALAVLIAQKNVNLIGVTTAFGETEKRAQVAAKLLKVMGHGAIPVYAGRPNGNKIREQYAWAKDFQSRSIKKEPAIEFLRKSIEKNLGEVTIVAIGALTNLADLFTKYPEVKSKIKQIVIMGGAVYTCYNNQAPPVIEWNIRCDPPAAKMVYESGVPLTMAGLEATTMMHFSIEHQKRLYAHGTPTTDALAALTILWGNNVPTLFDGVAVAWAAGVRFCDSELRHVEVTLDGMTRFGEGKPNVTVLIHPQKEAFLEWNVKTLEAK